MQAATYPGVALCWTTVIQYPRSFIELNWNKFGKVEKYRNLHNKESRKWFLVTLCKLKASQRIYLKVIVLLAQTKYEMINVDVLCGYYSTRNWADVNFWCRVKHKAGAECARYPYCFKVAALEIPKFHCGAAPQYHAYITRACQRQTRFYWKAKPYYKLKTELLSSVSSSWTIGKVKNL